MLSFLYVHSDHSILECYNLFSGVELSMRSFFVIILVSLIIRFLSIILFLCLILVSLYNTCFSYNTFSLYRSCFSYNTFSLYNTCFFYNTFSLYNTCSSYNTFLNYNTFCLTGCPVKQSDASCGSEVTGWVNSTCTESPRDVTP